MKLIASSSVVPHRPSTILLLGYLSDGTAVFGGYRPFILNSVLPRLRQLPSGAWSMLFLQPEALHTLEQFERAVYAHDVCVRDVLSPAVCGISAVIAWRLRYEQTEAVLRAMQPLIVFFNSTTSYPKNIFRMAYSFRCEL